MRNMPSKFIELFDSSPSSPKRISTHDVRLEDVLAHQEASLTSLQSRSSTFSSSKLSLNLVDKDRERELSFSPSPTTTSTTTQRSHTHTPASSRWKRLSSMLGSRRASWLYSTEYPACIYTIWRVDVLCMHTHTHTPQYIQSTWYYAFTHIAIIAIICYYAFGNWLVYTGLFWDWLWDYWISPFFFIAHTHFYFRFFFVSGFEIRGSRMSFLTFDGFENDTWDDYVAFFFILFSLFCLWVCSIPCI